MTNWKGSFGAGTRCSESTRTQRDPRVSAALLYMPCDVHALVQDTHDPNPVVLGYVEYHVGLILKPPQPRREFLGRAPMPRLFRMHLEPLMQAQEIDPRLFQSEMKDRVFVDAIEIGGGFRREAIDGHPPSAAFPLPP